MANLSSMSTFNPAALDGQSVKTFSVSLDNFAATLFSGDAVGEIETALQQNLPQCQGLIRWAVVKVEGDRFLCEGAYITLPA